MPEECDNINETPSNIPIFHPSILPPPFHSSILPRPLFHHQLLPPMLTAPFHTYYIDAAAEHRDFDFRLAVSDFRLHHFFSQRIENFQRSAYYLILKTNSQPVTRIRVGEHAEKFFRNQAVRRSNTICINKRETAAPQRARNIHRI